MEIAVRGVVQTLESGQISTAVVVNEGTPYKVTKLKMGVDIKVNRGEILTFLSAIYGIAPGKIGWPEHIQV